MYLLTVLALTLPASREQFYAQLLLGVISAGLLGYQMRQLKPSPMGLFLIGLIGPFVLLVLQVNWGFSALAGAMLLAAAIAEIVIRKRQRNQSS